MSEKLADIIAPKVLVHHLVEWGYAPERRQDGTFDKTAYCKNCGIVIGVWKKVFWGFEDDDEKHALAGWDIKPFHWAVHLKSCNVWHRATYEDAWRMVERVSSGARRTLRKKQDQDLPVRQHFGCFAHFTGDFNAFSR